MSLGKDLASIRKSQNLSLEDIQNAIKIPLETLKRIENDRIFSDSTENKTYVRSFVRSYAKVLKIEDDEIIKALDEQEAGTYAGRLLGETSQPNEPTEDDTPEPKSEEKPKSRDTKPAPPSSPQQKASKPGEPTEKPKPQPAPEPTGEQPKNSPDSINWADMGHKFTPTGKNSKIWLVVILVIVILGALGSTGYYYSDDLLALFEQQTEVTDDQGNPDNNSMTAPVDTLNTEEATTAGSEENQADDAQQETVSAEPITLGDTLSVAVYAAYGQLEPIRVTSDFNWRTNPFWMEEGEAYWFDFSDTLLVRGQYSRLLLLFNGHVIENPRNNYFDPAFNSIMITRDVLDQPRYLNPAPEEFPLDIGAPDSITYRIQF